MAKKTVLAVSRSIPIKIFMGGFIGGIMILNNVYKGELTTKLSLTLVPSPIGTLSMQKKRKGREDKIILFMQTPWRLSPVRKISR